MKLQAELSSIACPAILGKVIEQLVSDEDVGRVFTACNVPIGAGAVAITCGRTCYAFQLFHTIAIGEEQATPMIFVGDGCSRQPDRRISARVGISNGSVVTRSRRNPRVDAIVKL